jgi:hypothetical protein
MVGAICASLTFLVTTASFAQGVKWHPGHYVMFPTGDSPSQHLIHIDEIGDEPTIQGVQIRIRWSDVEVSRGVYDFSTIDAYLQRVKAQPTTKRLVVRIIDRSFNTSSPNGILPSYMLTPEFNGGVVRTKTGYAARLWESAVMDRLIALYKRIGWRYDNDMHLEGVATEETTLSLAQPFPAGYSHAALTSQYVRFVRSVRPSMPRTNLFLYSNWIGSSTLMSDLIQSLVDPYVSAGGSNVFPGKKTLGQRVWTGEYGADYRWSLALSSSVETQELREYSLQEIANWAFNDLHLHYVFWVRNTWAGDASKRWETGILPFLRTKPRVRTRCPNSYGICIK